MSPRKKIALLGEFGVGKTSLIRRLVFDRFEGSYKSTLGFDVFTFDLDGVGPDGNERLPIVLWDTDGNLGVNILNHEIYMDGMAGALVVADVTRPETHQIAADLVHAFLDRYAGRPYAFVLNKCDLVDGTPVTPSPLAPLIGPASPLVRTSAKTGDNVVYAYRTIANAILRLGIED